jgi:hypothetical protein
VPGPGWDFQEKTEDDWDDGQNEAFLANELLGLYKAETATYDALRTYQGRLIPVFSRQPVSTSRRRTAMTKLASLGISFISEESYSSTSGALAYQTFRTSFLGRPSD